MTPRELVAAGLLLWAGATLLLSRRGRFARVSLADRLRPFHPGVGGPERRRPDSPEGEAAPLAVLASWAQGVGDALAGLFGVGDVLAARLGRVHSRESPTSFRLRQLGWSLAALVAGVVVAALARLPLPAVVLLAVGAPLLAFLVVEQSLSKASERWQRRTAQELPVIAEQLAMLLGGGYSLGAAIARLAQRGRGCIAADLDDVSNRILQGLSEADALSEWADRSGVESVGRLVSVLTLHAESADLGRLVAVEARQARRDLHRRDVETIERRAQQVWVPVTVATLVPGAILLAVPFLSALRIFSNA